MFRTIILLFMLFGSCFASAQAPDTAFTAEIARHRELYKAEFLSDSRSPLTAKDTALLDFFAANPGWRVIARFEPEANAVSFDMPTYSGRSKKFAAYGKAHFSIAGANYTLTLYQNQALLQQEGLKDHLFLPFKDHSNGDSTYGGGRYIDLHTGDIAADGTLVLDFNKCYNPWCAYSDGYNCPVPPPANHLELAVEAGEKNFRGEKKH